MPHFASYTNKQKSQPVNLSDNCVTTLQLPTILPPPRDRQPPPPFVIDPPAHRSLLAHRPARFSLQDGAAVWQPAAGDAAAGAPERLAGAARLVRRRDGHVHRDARLHVPSAVSSEGSRHRGRSGARGSALRPGQPTVGPLRHISSPRRRLPRRMCPRSRRCTRSLRSASTRCHSSSRRSATLASRWPSAPRTW
jgi:hypothetical protein